MANRTGPDDSVEFAAKAARARCQVALEIYDMCVGRGSWAVRSVVLVGHGVSGNGVGWGRAGRGGVMISLFFFLRARRQGHVFQNDYDNPVAREAVNAMAAFVRKEVSRSASVPSQRPRL